MNNRVILLTGEKQTGKTTLLEKWIAARNNAGGILSPVRNGKRMFFDIATQNSFEMEASAEERHLMVGPYTFSARAFEKASGILSNAVADKRLNYLVIDEIGPLELEQNRGLYAALIAILEQQLHLQLVLIVRPALEHAICALIQNHKKEPLVLTLDDWDEFWLNNHAY